VDQFAQRPRRSPARFRAGWSQSSAMFGNGSTPGPVPSCIPSTTSPSSDRVTKGVFAVNCVAENSLRYSTGVWPWLRRASRGPTAVVIPYNLFLEMHDFRVPPPPAPRPAVGPGRDRPGQFSCWPIGGCESAFMPASAAWTTAEQLLQAAELLQAAGSPPASTGKGAVIPRDASATRSAGGYGPQRDAHGRGGV